MLNRGRVTSRVDKVSEELTVGASRIRSFLVDRDRSIDFMGEDARDFTWIATELS